MTFNLRELYQEVIIDHNKYPRNHYTMEDPTAVARGANPLCGDKLTVYIKIDGDLVEKVSFLGHGCAISQASASLMTEAMVGKTKAEAEALFQHFHRLLTEEGETTQGLDKLAVLSGVRAFPARVKCATLAWHTFEACLHKDKQLVTTE